MFKRLASFISMALLLVSLSGCVFLIIGTAGAVGGYAITRDTIQGEYDVNYQDAWKSALKSCSMLGIVTTKDSGRGLIEATVDGAKTRVELAQLTPESVRIKVKARKGIFPRLGTAERVFVKIVQQLM